MKRVTLNNRNIIIIFALILIFILGVFFRLKGIISRNLEYDEIWTLTNYSNKSLLTIFTELATPNNHPVNSLLIKITTSVFGENNFALRLPALLAGIGLTIITATLGLRLFNNKVIAFIIFIFVSFNGALVHYSQTARGYEIQAFLIILLLYSIVSIEKSESENVFVSFTAFFILPVISVMTIPTSILFITPLIIFHCLYLLSWDNFGFLLFSECIRDKRLKLFFRNKKVIFYLCSYIIMISWMLLNYSQFKSGQSFGQTISNYEQLYDFTIRLITEVISWPFYIFCLLGVFLNLKKNRLISLSVVITFVFIVLTSLIFKAGPDRVYLPFIPCFIVVASASFFNILSLAVKNKKMLTVCIMICSIFWIFDTFPKELKKWTPPDYKRIYNELCKTLPINYYICFPAGDGFPASYKNTFGLRENYLRIPKFKEQYIAVYGTENNLQGLNKSTNISNFTLPEKTVIRQFGNIKVYLYKLLRLDSSVEIENQIVLMSFPLNSYNKIEKLKSYLVYNLKYTDLILINSWFRYPVMSSKGQKMTGALIAIKDLKVSIKSLLNVEHNTAGAVKFYILKEISD